MAAVPTRNHRSGITAVRSTGIRLRLRGHLAAANIRHQFSRIRVWRGGLATLFIIDQSLKEMGGHHFDYTCLITQAAAQMGIDPVIGTNRLLRPDAEQRLAHIAQVEKVFRETTYSHLSHLAGLKELVGRDAGRWSLRDRRPDPDRSFLHNFLGNIARKKRIRLRSRLIRQFAEDCDTFFQRFSLEESDQVFFTTMSELEFMGLTAYLGSHPKTIQATWHVQFHFSMFSGRPDEFADQSREEQLLTGAFQSALARAPYHDIRAYTTSDELAIQYNRMKLLTFESLPYPVNPDLYADPHRAKSGQPLGPLRMTVAGGVRREKGQKTQVNQLIHSIWDSHIAKENVRLDIQSGNRNAFTFKRVMKGRRVSHKQFQKMVCVHPHPLPESDYVGLIHDSNIGLFCYDSRRYYSRRAGILSEFLACGKPVIVPAGSWLSRQIMDPACRHIESLIDQAQFRQTLDVTNLQWSASNVPLAGRSISFDQTRHPFRCRFHRSDLTIDQPDGLVVDFRWQWPREAGSFVQVSLHCFDDREQPIGCERQVVTIQNDNLESVLFLRVPAGFSHGELVFRNAWIDSSISIADVKVSFLDFGNQAEPPRSAVGIIAADESMMVSAVDEIVKHYDHYHESAVRFSALWSAWHDPVRTVETLMPVAAREQRAA